MSREASLRTVDAIELVLDAPKDAPITAYRAAKQMQLDISSFYKGRLYKLYRDGQIAELRQAMADIRARAT